MVGGPALGSVLGLVRVRVGTSGPLDRIVPLATETRYAAKELSSQMAVRATYGGYFPNHARSVKRGKALYLVVQDCCRETPRHELYPFQKTHGSYSLGNLQPHSHWRKNIHVPIHGQCIVVIVCHQQGADTVIDGPITCIAQLYSNFDACPSQPADAFRTKRVTRMPRSAVYKHRTKPC